LLPEEARRHRYVEQVAFEIAGRYGFGEIITPIFEFTEVFARTLGETSDVVSKEMYSFTDRGGESLTLRPEGTAGVARALISGGLTQSLPLKFFYRGPMFRYERPQKGRQRQFHQIGVELLGVEGPQADIEIIAVGAHILAALGLSEHITIEINSLGDSESRSDYRAALVAYLSDFRDRLSPDSQARLERNPLRVLDSKDEGDKQLVADAPLLIDHLNAESRNFFAKVQEGLALLGLPVKVNPRLVRGLDYYSHTAFEFITSALGAQGTVMAGGRYDGLVGQMGGPATAGIGWAAGIERLSMLMGAIAEPLRPIAVIPTQDDGVAFALAQRLRHGGFTVELGYSGNLKKRLIRANKARARAAVILGEDEASRQAATVRDLDSGVQEEVRLASLEVHLARYR
jgi:histidyl-tRNA synthetase